MSKNKFETLILDIDGGVTSQKYFMSQYDGSIIHLRDQTSGFRFWCHKDEMNELIKRIRSECLTEKPKAIFYGSGDYHHLAYVGISMIEEPFTVIHFDNHSDFWREEFVNLLAFGRRQKGSEYFNYGSWINPALRLPNVKKVVQFGVDGDFKIENYLFFPKGMMTHSFDLIIQNRVETYTNQMKHSLLFGRLKGSTPCVDFKPGLFTTDAEWKNMNDHGGIQATVEDAVSRIPTDAVYVTIDKDVLDENENFSAYPGNSGKMRLSELLCALSFIGKTKRVVGLDVCGDASSYDAIEDVKTFTKKYMAKRQYGRISKEMFSDKANIAMNEKVNIMIMEQFN